MSYFISCYGKGMSFVATVARDSRQTFISSSKITLNENPDLIPKKLTPHANTGTSCMEARRVFAFKGKKWIHAVHWDEWSEFTITAGTEVCSLQFPVGGPLIESRLNDELDYPVVFQHDFHGLDLSQSKEKFLLKIVHAHDHFIQTESSTKQILRWYYQAIDLQLPPSLKPVEALSQMTTTWS